MSTYLLSEHPFGDRDNRYEVTVKLAFLRRAQSDMFTSTTKADSIVMDQDVFNDCLDWKQRETEEVWRTLRDFKYH